VPIVFAISIVLAVIAVAVSIPAMVVLAAAPVPIPVAFIKTFPVMTRSYPARAFVGRTSPITVVPPIPAPNGIPIAVYPDIAGSGKRWPYSNHSRRGRRTDPDSYSDLSAADR
jgi:hypothetical protein